jgi:hypothetical protein
MGDGQPQAESLTRNLIIPAAAFAKHRSTQSNYWGEVGAIPVAFGCFAMIFSLDLLVSCPGKMKFLCTKSSLVRYGPPVGPT